MKLHCFGTAGYHPSQTRHTSCYYLPEHGIVLDAGSGLFQLTEYLLREPRETLDCFLSHAHLDHTFGLTFLLDIVAATKLQRVRVYGAADKLKAIQEHLFAETMFPVLPPIDYRPLDADRGLLRLSDEVHVEWFPLEHPGGSTGYRFTLRDRILAYVTDTVARPEAEYLTLIRGIDLLMHECNFSDEYQDLAMKTGHSWHSAVMEVVQRTKPKKTLLIHLNPLSDLLGTPIQLGPMQTALNMQIASDLDCVEF